MRPRQVQNAAPVAAALAQLQTFPEPLLRRLAQRHEGQAKYQAAGTLHTALRMKRSAQMFAEPLFMRY